jgi:hypothetical protein
MSNMSFAPIPPEGELRTGEFMRFWETVNELLTVRRAAPLLYGEAVLAWQNMRRRIEADT